MANVLRHLMKPKTNTHVFYCILQSAYWCEALALIKSEALAINREYFGESSGKAMKNL